MNPGHQVTGFPALSSASARVLVLGTAPSKASLQRQQYYGHNRNAFWPIMANVLAFELEQSYPVRVQALVDARLAVWDVLASCERASSADADIVEATALPNDIPGFVRAHGELRAILLNGGKAEQLFRRHVAPALEGVSVVTRRMPSTSPAYAAMRFEQKLAQWRLALDEFL